MGASKSKRGGKRSGGTSTKTPQPWEMQPGETAGAFAKFVAYRDMPVRGTRGLAAQLGLKDCTVAELCKDHEWVRRAAAWDAEVDRRQLEAQVQELEKVRRQQIQLGTALEMVGAVEVQALQRKIQRADETAKQMGFVRENILTVKDIVRVIVAGSQLQRVNLNLPTSIDKHQINVGEAEAVDANEYGSKKGLSEDLVELIRQKILGGSAK